MPRTRHSQLALLLRPLLRHLTTSRSTHEGSKSLCAHSSRRNCYFGSTMHFTVRWLKTFGVAELDRERSSKYKNLGESLPDVQHAALKHEHRVEAFDTLLAYPGGVSTDLAGELIFISDTLHNRIIITNADGKVLDHVGSSAGYEDGSFETAQLRSPCSTFYHPEQNCLFIADCENHCIRRADLITRMLETVYPLPENNGRPGIVQRWLQWLGLKKVRPDPVSKREVHVGEEQIRLSYPWHLAMASNGQFVAATHWFGSLWIIDVNTGEAAKDPDQDRESIFKKFMSFKSAALRDTKLEWEHVHETLFSKGLANKGFPNVVSQVATFRHGVLVSDPETQQILKMELSSGDVTMLQLSNLGILGVPSWWPTPVHPQLPRSLSSKEKLEDIYEQHGLDEHVADFQIQPGRCLICVDVALPRGTSLAEPVNEDILWRQGRGCLVELSLFDGELATHKVSAAQQYLDDLNTLSSAHGSAMNDHTKGDPTEEDLLIPEQSPSGLPFYSYVDVSLGTGEVVFDAVLYLKRTSSVGSPYRPIPTRKLELSNSSSSSSTNSNPDQPVPLRTGSNFNKRVIDYPDGALLLKHLRLRVRFEASKDAPVTRMLLLDVQL